MTTYSQKYASRIYKNLHEWNEEEWKRNAYEKKQLVNTGDISPETA